MALGLYESLWRDYLAAVTDDPNNRALRFAQNFIVTSAGLDYLRDQISGSEKSLRPLQWQICFDVVFPRDSEASLGVRQSLVALVDVWKPRKICLGSLGNPNDFTHGSGVLSNDFSIILTALQTENLDLKRTNLVLWFVTLDEMSANILAPLSPRLKGLEFWECEAIKTMKTRTLFPLHFLLLPGT